MISSKRGITIYVWCVVRFKLQQYFDHLSCGTIYQKMDCVANYVRILQNRLFHPHRSRICNLWEVIYFQFNVSPCGSVNNFMFSWDEWSMIPPSSQLLIKVFIRRKLSPQSKNQFEKCRLQELVKICIPESIKQHRAHLISLILICRKIADCMKKMKLWE